MHTESTSDKAKLKRHGLSIFRRVISLYDEYKYAQGTSGAQRESLSTNCGIVRMCHSDFICDVETSALRCLTKPEHDFFTHVIKNKDESFVKTLSEGMGKERYDRVKNRVQAKLGLSFEKRGIFPTSDYFRAVDTR